MARLGVTGGARVVIVHCSCVLATLAGCGQEHSGPASGSGGSSASGGSANAGGASGGTPSAIGGGVGSGGVSSGGANQAGGGAQQSGGGGSASGGASGGSDGASGGSGGAPDAGSVLVPDPSWTCGAPEGIVDPELGELVFEVTLSVGGAYEVGETQYGERRVLDIVGGEFSSAEINGEFLSGGLDFELTLPGGAREIEQVNVLRAEGGSVIYLRTCGVALSGQTKARIVPDFEAPNSSEFAWLNTGDFVGTHTFDPTQSELHLAIYDVALVPAQGAEITLTDPSGVPDQPWECSTNVGTKGETVFTETVAIGASLSVGASKRGNRNIIPITGGTVTGQFEGEVLPGGADYQLLGGTTTLDARYTLQSYDGEYLVVRNCGPFGALIPWFEARVDGPYAFLNEGAFLSSDPGSAGGGVSITFYERQ